MDQTTPPSPRPLPPARSDFPFLLPVTSRWSDNDMFGHLNNAAYYALFDTAVTTWMARAGIPLAPGSRIFFVVETSCRYRAQIAFPDRITVGLRLERLGTSSVRYALAAFRGDDPRAAAEGTFAHVKVDPQTHRPLPLDHAERSALEGLRP